MLEEDVLTEALKYPETFRRDANAKELRGPPEAGVTIRTRTLTSGLLVVINTFSAAAMEDAKVRVQLLCNKVKRE